MFLTGATGYLGAYLLHGLLTRSGADVVCLVRAKSEDDGRRRIAANVAKYLDWDPAWDARVFPVVGDLGDPRLGLSEDGFRALAERTDAIVHNGGVVNFTLPYRGMRGANVEGTAWVLRLACAGRATPCTSSPRLGVHVTRETQGVPVHEDDALPEAARVHDAYNQTKWVADTLVQAVAARGVPVTLHRPARVGPDYRTGASNADDYYARMLRAAAEVGAVPDLGWNWDVAPVDQVAAAIVQAVVDPAWLGGTFHYFNPHVLPFSDITAAVREAGWPVEELPYAQWRARALAAAMDSSHPLHPLMPLFPSELKGNLAPRFVTPATTRLMEAAGVAWTDPDRAFVGRTLRYFVRTGVLAGPRHPLGVPGMMETFRVLRTFLIVWIGQIVSTVGSSLTGFVLGVWVYQQTGSATQFALIALCATVPSILPAPIAGALVDRHDRRTVMILADFGAAACTVTLALLYAAGVLEVWHIWAATGITAICGAFQGPAYGASLSMLVPPEHRARANGLMQTGQALAIIAPVVAAGLVASIGVLGVIAIDLCTFAFAVVTLFIVLHPAPARERGGACGPGTLRREAAYGWEYLRERPGLFWLTVLFAFFNFFISISAVLVQPLILSFSSVGSLGWLMMAGGSGMLAGSLVMGAWRAQAAHQRRAWILDPGRPRDVHARAGALALAHCRDGPGVPVHHPLVGGSYTAMAGARAAGRAGPRFATAAGVLGQHRHAGRLPARPAPWRTACSSLGRWPPAAPAGVLGPWIGTGTRRGSP